MYPKEPPGERFYRLVCPAASTGASSAPGIHLALEHGHGTEQPGHVDGSESHAPVAEWTSTRSTGLEPG